MRALIVALVLCTSGAALADNGATHAANAARADQLFKKGKRLLAQKKYAEACTAFEQSDHLDPGIGAKLNVAKCYQDWGKLATAWRWYVEAETMATGARDERARKIRALIEELDPTVPRLTVKAPPGADLTGIRVKLDGVALEASALGVEQRLDPGPHEIDTVFRGLSTKQVVPVERGGSAEVVIETPVPGTGEAGPASPRSIDTHDGATPPTGEVVRAPGRTQRLIGIGLTGAGGLAIAVAGALTLGARRDYHRAIESHCQGATDLCDDEGLSITHDARHRANVATLVTLGGVVAAASGLLIYVTAPAAPRTAEHALYLAPSVGADGGGVVLGGAF